MYKAWKKSESRNGVLEIPGLAYITHCPGGDDGKYRLQMGPVDLKGDFDELINIAEENIGFILQQFKDDFKISPEPTKVFWNGVVEIEGNDETRKIPVKYRYLPHDPDLIECFPIKGGNPFTTHYKSLFVGRE